MASEFGNKLNPIGNSESQEESRAFGVPYSTRTFQAQ